MATNKQLMVQTFNNTLNNNYYQSQLKATLKENAGVFATSLMELVTSDEKLLSCDAKLLMAEAMKAASLKLPLNKQLGQCYILPFKNKGVMTPTLVIGTRGYLQLAMRTGKYETINADVVYEGEINGYDKVTGKLDLSGTRTSNVPVGYFAYMKRKDGFSKLLYMSLDDVCDYAKRYSPTVKYNDKMTVEKLKESAIFQSKNGNADGVGWYANFESMAIKTCLRQLISKWGELSIESANVISFDDSVSAEVKRDSEFAEAKEIKTVDAETGEIIEEEKTESQPSKPKLNLED